MEVFEDWYKHPLTQVGVYEGSEHPLNWRIYPEGSDVDALRSNPETLVVMRGSKVHMRAKAMNYTGPKCSFAEILGERYLRRLYYRLQAAGFPTVTTIAFPALRSYRRHRFFPRTFYRLTDALANVLGSREALHPTSEKSLASSLNGYNKARYSEASGYREGLRNAVGFRELCDVWGDEFTKEARDWCNTPLLNYLMLGLPETGQWLLIRDRPEQTWKEREAAQSLLENMLKIEYLREQMARPPRKTKRAVTGTPRP